VSGRLEEGEIPREGAVVEPSGEVEPSKKKLKIKLSSATTSASSVQAPPVPITEALSLDFDTEVFAKQATLPLPNFLTLTEIDNYSLAMTSEEFTFNEYGPLGGH